VPTQSYERYGLTGNPFRDLASENLDDVGIFHVNQEVDETLRTIKDEILDKENRAVVAIVGEYGSGKTERLLLAASEGRERKAFTVYYDVTTKVGWVLRGLAEEFRKRATAAGAVRMFHTPPWFRAMAGLAKGKDQSYDAKQVGRTLGTALNDQAPSMLLLNDLHNLIETKEIDSFARVLQELADVIKPGVLVMFTCYPSYVAWLTVNHPGLASRINRTFLLHSLGDDEASLILAKKLLAKRVVEDLDPIYPFDPEAVKELNRASGGNPRRLLEFADLAVEYGVAHRAYRVDVEVVRAILAQRQAGGMAAQMLSSPAFEPTTAPAPTPAPRPSAKAMAAPSTSAAWSEGK